MVAVGLQQLPQTRQAVSFLDAGVARDETPPIALAYTGSFRTPTDFLLSTSEMDFLGTVPSFQPTIDLGVDVTKLDDRSSP